MHGVLSKSIGWCSREKVTSDFMKQTPSQPVTLIYIRFSICMAEVVIVSELSIHIIRRSRTFFWINDCENRHCPVTVDRINQWINEWTNEWMHKWVNTSLKTHRHTEAIRKSLTFKMLLYTELDCSDRIWNQWKRPFETPIYVEIIFCVSVCIFASFVFSTLVCIYILTRHFPN